MLFVKSEDLKYGMRLAKPIYNKTGVLLYERNTRLTLQGIESVKNFGLLGLYILKIWTLNDFRRWQCSVSGKNWIISLPAENQ